MAKPVAFISYGQGGAFLGAILSGGGTKILSGRLAKIATVPEPFNWDHAHLIAAKIKLLPADAKIIVGGTSLGANEAPRIGALVSPRPIDLMFGIQPSMYGAKNLLTSNVRRAVYFANPWWFPVGAGFGSYNWQRAAGNNKTVLVYHQTLAPHPGDNIGWIHDMLFNEVAKLV